MDISLDWISDFVDLTGLDLKQIVSRLTLATAEVEGVKEINRFVDGVLVGEIKTVTKMTEKLTFCEVDCGNKTYQTVCGAPNVRVGLKAPFAPAGTTLAENKRIEKSEISGKVTEGILCSAAELGMSGWHEILLECPANIKPGTPLEQLVPKTDTLIEIDNKSLTHRPDLWGHYGFAREFAAIFERPLKPLPMTDLAAFDKLPEYPIENADTENCPCYGCIEFGTIGTQPSPLVMQRRLHALGLRTYNLLVDVTNYVNWEIGQPTHAFDAEKLGSIRVATVEKSTKFQTLDGQNRDLQSGDLMIWGTTPPFGHPSEGGEYSLPSEGVGGGSSFRPVALAGIMGGLETEVTESTKRILLESANFKAARIRKTSGRLDLRTDASQRYEKSQPPSNVKVAVARILKLLEEGGATPKVSSRFSFAGDLHDKVRTITLEPGQLVRAAGIDLPNDNVVGILTSLGFAAQFGKDGKLTVGVPAFRGARDISIPEDIVEEVLRVFGFDNIPPKMPVQPIKPLFVEKYIKMEHKAKKVLATGHRFLEVHLYSWTNDNFLKALGYESNEAETLVLRNPTSPETARLRTTLMPNLLALVPKNRQMRDAFRVFELGRVYFHRGPNESLEQRHLAGVAFQQTGSIEDFYLSVKSAVEDFFDIFGYTTNKNRNEAERNDGNKTVKFVTASQNGTYPWQAADHWVEMKLGNETVGSMGVIEKNLLQKITPEGGQIVWFDIDLEKLDGTLYPTVRFTEPPRYPLSWQDFSIVWPVEDGFEKLEAKLDQFRNSLIVKREFLMSYKGKGLEKGTASYSFRFWIGSSDHTLTGDELDAFHQNMLEFLKQNSMALRS